MFDFFKKGETAEAPEQKMEEIPEWRMKNLFTLDRRSYELLKRRVEASKGIVRVTVHPFYEAYYYPRFYKSERYQKENPKIRQIEGTIKKLLSFDPSRVPPLIIFEERSHMSETEKKLQEGNKPKDTAYVVPTRRGASIPDIYDDEIPPRNLMTEEEALDKESEAERKGWLQFTSTLEDLGVGEVIIGGMYFSLLKTEELFRMLEEKGKLDQVEAIQKELDKDAEGKHFGYYAIGCVSSVIKALKRAKIPFSISPLTFPHGTQERNMAQKNPSEGWS